MSQHTSNTNRNSIKVRVVFLGDQGVGKSSIIDRAILNNYEDTHNPTVGIDFNVKDMARGGSHYRMQMWDTAGQQRYRSLIPTYLKNANCAVFVYDVTRTNSLNNIKMWHEMFRQHQEAPGILVANKIDLSQARKVTKQEALKFAQQFGMRYHEVSAKTGKKVLQLFEDTLDVIIDQKRKEEQFVDGTDSNFKDGHRRKMEEGVEVEERGRQQKVSIGKRAVEMARKANCCEQ